MSVRTAVVVGSAEPVLVVELKEAAVPENSAVAAAVAVAVVVAAAVAAAVVVVLPIMSVPAAVVWQR